MGHIKTFRVSGELLVLLGDSDGLRLIPFSSYPILLLSSYFYFYLIIFYFLKL